MARPPTHAQGFYGGDLRGVTIMLDYIAGLGVTRIYFTPIFDLPDQSPLRRHRLHDDRSAAGHRSRPARTDRGGGQARHPILLDACLQPLLRSDAYTSTSPTEFSKGILAPIAYYRWFDFLHRPEQVWCGRPGSRSKLDIPGMRHMPEFVECPEVEDFFFGKEGIAQRWLSLGTAGWRTDVTPWLTDEFWRRFRRAVRRDYPEAYLVAEDWERTPTSGGRHLRCRHELSPRLQRDELRARQAAPAELDDRLETRRRDTPPASFQAQMNILASHDTARLLTRLEGSKERMILAASMQLAYPGAPMIYYGDEAGIEGTFAEDGRRPFPWGREDPELLAFYRTAANARRHSPALSKGDITTVWIDERGGYGFCAPMKASECLPFSTTARNRSEPPSPPAKMPGMANRRTSCHASPRPGSRRAAPRRYPPSGGRLVPANSS